MVCAVVMTVSPVFAVSVIASVVAVQRNRTIRRPSCQLLALECDHVRVLLHYFCRARYLGLLPFGSNSCAFRPKAVVVGLVLNCKPSEANSHICPCSIGGLRVLL